MDRITLPRSELTVSRLCCGCWGLTSDRHWGPRDREQSIATLQAALDAGVNFFDTAPMYAEGESERLVGQVLAPRRQEVVIATKVHPGKMAPAELIASCEESLRRLQTETIDLYQTHWTSPDVPIAESWGAMRKLQQQGKVRAIGVCNMGPGDLSEVCGDQRPASDQLPYSLLWRAIEHQILPFCRTEDIAVLAYSPLMHGLLAGQYASADEVPEGRARSRHFRGDRPLVRHGEAGCEGETFAALESLRAICRELGRSMADVALAWCFQQPGVGCVIAGASSPRQLQQNVASLERPLAADILRRLNDVTQPLADALGPNPDMWEGTARSRFR